MKRAGLFWLTVVMPLGLVCNQANAQLPPDFPGVTVTTCDSNAMGDGFIFLEVTDSSAGGYYVMVLNNDGTPVWYQTVASPTLDFTVLPNGYLHYASLDHPHSWTDGGDCTHQILDESYNPVETITAGNGYVADAHDFQWLPNGHVLLLGYYKTPMDLSPYVAGGNPNALVAGAIIQELDAQRNVVFQWRSWDHFTIPTYFSPAALTNNATMTAVLDAFHLNTVLMDTDGNLLVSNFGMDVWKISRQTGEILWRLGGPANQFSFVGEDPQQALGHFSGHTLSRLENGNIMIYCNADQRATRSSKIYEYNLDEPHKVATLLWVYTPPTNHYAWHYGSAQRLANGNTFIGWGSASTPPGASGVTTPCLPACTEVTPEGRVVFEMKFNDPNIASYRAFRFVYPPAAQANVSWFNELTPGNFYDFDQTGVSIAVLNSFGGYNQLTVTSEPYAPLNPQFEGQAPRVLPGRVSLTQWGIPELTAELDFDAATFAFADPANITVYYRPQIGQGVFLPQMTAFNPFTGKVLVEMTLTSPYDQLGEFIFCYPDVTEVTNPPLLAAVENYRGVQTAEVVAPLPAWPGANYLVNQELPVALVWSPQGLAGGYHLQIATDPDFSDPVVDVPDQAEAFFVWSDAAQDTAYFYRVNTTNDAGTSDWSVGSFQTVAPNPPTLTRIQQNQDGAWVLQWTGASSGVYVEFNATLDPGQWQTIVGPISGSAWTNTPVAAPQGFYRLRVPYNL